LYFLANLAATINAGRNTKISILPYVSLSFIILHISYELGFIKGLFAFSNRWKKSENEKVVEAKF
jgi:hypothetical protein